MTIRVAINEILEKQGKTAYWLAKETGLSHTVIGKIRHGQNQSITFETLDAICNVLDCGVEEVLVREKSQEEKTPQPARISAKSGANSAKKK